MTPVRAGLHSLAILAACLVFAAAPLRAASGAEPTSEPKRYYPACPPFAVDLEFDCYRDFSEVEQFLRDAAARYPQYATLESIGESWQGRDLWVMTITDRSTGAPGTKPAIWVDGGVDADEVISIEAALGVVHRLLTSNDPQVERLRRTRTFYVAPAVIPDSSELHMTTAERPRDTTLRPWDDDGDGRLDEDGPEDLDGDGEALSMRRLDPNGAWTPREEDARLLRRRLPGDPGPFYELWVEGVDDDEDGEYQEDRLGGVDPNRNYPGNWSLGQGGNGPFGGSETEVRALLDFVVAHPDIAASQHLHSSGGVVLRPPSVPDMDMPADDLALYLAVAERGLEVTGYDLATSVYDWNWPSGTINTKRGQVRRDEDGDLRGGPGAGDAYAAYGGSIDAMYELFGVLAFANEIYRLGEDDDGNGRIDDWERLRASDEELGGAAFREWTTFDHPQLGEVEIGGWRKFGQNNPLGERIAEEVIANVDFVLMQAEQVPEIGVADVEVSALGDGVFRIEAEIANNGFSPTELAVRVASGRAVPVRARLELGDAELLSAENMRALGVLPGHGSADAEWLVRAPAGRTVRLVASHPRGGTATADVELH